MSVRLTTPLSLPDMFAPGSEDAETDGEAEVWLIGGKTWGDAGRGGTVMADCGPDGGRRGVVGIDDEGEGDSTTHILVQS